MRAVVQRVRRASVSVDDRVVSSIEQGLVVLLGVSVRDADADAEWMAGKVARLRIFPDDDDVMNRSVADHGGSVLAVSQFTLHGDARKGNRPSYIDAAPGEAAEPLYKRFCEAVRNAGVDVAEGVFGAMMDVALVNWGPVTILLDSERAF
ncbi:MAG: D-aminoacyl-tRNA deacylase [Actinomycetota bacterium]